VAHPDKIATKTTVLIERIRINWMVNITAVGGQRSLVVSFIRLVNYGSFFSEAV